jgi:diguanylate cyclase (GGDEF)-like protein
MSEKQKQLSPRLCGGSALTPQQLVFENSWLRSQLRLARDEISQARQQLDLLQQQNQVDYLTQTPTRMLLKDRAQQAFRQAGREQRTVLVIFIDLDHFKQINDHFGHSTGDQVLVQIALRLSGCLRASDTVCRYGGDEFVLLLPQESEHDAIEVIVDKLMFAVTLPMTANAHFIIPEVSMGVAVFPRHGIELDVLIEKADKAMYAAKVRGGQRYQISQSELS